MGWRDDPIVSDDSGGSWRDDPIVDDTADRRAQSQAAAARESGQSFLGAAGTDLANSTGRAVVGAGHALGDIASGVGSMLGYGLRAAVAPIKVAGKTIYNAATGGDITAPLTDEVTSLVNDNPGIAMAKAYGAGLSERGNATVDAYNRGDLQEAAYQGVQTAGALVPGYHPVSKIGERAVGLADSQDSILDADPAASGDLAAQLVVAAGPGKTLGAIENVTGLPVATAASALADGAGNLASKVTAPFAGSVSPEVEAAVGRINTDVGPTGLRGVNQAPLDLPASALSDSKVVPLIEASSAKGLGGSGTAARYEKAFSDITSKADRVVEDASKFSDDMARGNAISKGLKEYKSNWIKRKNSLYKQAELPERADLALQAQGTVDLLDNVISEKRAAGNAGVTPQGLKFYERMRDGLTETAKDGTRSLKTIQARDLLKAQRELGQRISGSYASPFAAADKGLLQKLHATLSDEIDAGIRSADPKLGAQIDAAKQVYADGISKINSTFGKSIHRLARSGQYDKIASQVVRPSMSVADIPKILEVAGPEGAEAMRASVLSDIVSKAKGAGGQLTPGGLQRAMAAFGEDRLGALLEPEQLSKLNDLATVSKALEKGTKVMNGSQTAFAGRAISYPALALANPLVALKVIAGDAMFSKFVASEVGQKWLTTGFRPLSGQALARGVGVSARAGQAASDLASAPQAPPQAPPSNVIPFPRAADDDEMRAYRNSRRV